MIPPQVYVPSDCSSSSDDRTTADDLDRTNMVIILVMMQASKKVPFENPTVLMGVRVVYLLSNLIIAGIYYYTYLSIKRKKDMTTLKYVEPPQMGAAETEPKLVTTTIYGYDVTQLRQLWKSQLMGVGMMAVMHIYFKFTNPLLIQSILPLKGAFEGNLVKIHVLSKPAAGDLKRPWKAAGAGGAGFLGGLLGGGQDTGKNEIRSDKATVEAFEARGTGGAKEE